ncbi:hypothetical protein C8R47DRAFT_1295905 [Mycena vitilis]|nr:hypothetical protein C8R47DRAFT_1295905 [Mycena vitilis]
MPQSLRAASGNDMSPAVICQWAPLIISHHGHRQSGLLGLKAMSAVGPFNWRRNVPRDVNCSSVSTGILRMYSPLGTGNWKSILDYATSNFWPHASAAAMVRSDKDRTRQSLGSRSQVDPLDLMSRARPSMPNCLFFSFEPEFALGRFPIMRADDHWAATGQQVTVKNSQVDRRAKRSADHRLPLAPIPHVAKGDLPICQPSRNGYVAMTFYDASRPSLIPIGLPKSGVLNFQGVPGSGSDENHG